MSDVEQVPDMAEAARMLREIRADIERGELSARPTTAAYLAGAVRALEVCPVR